MNIETREVQIPFAGLYYSVWSDMVEHAEGQCIDNMVESGDLTEENRWDFADHLCRHMRHMPIYHNLAREYAEAYFCHLSDKVGFPITGEFVEMISPREYSFTTDRIFCRVDSEALLKILALPQVQEKLPAMLVQQHKSRDGFHSFYSHILGEGEWAEEPGEWDAIQWHTVLLCLEEKGDEMAICEAIQESVDNEVCDAIYAELDDFNATLAENEAEIENEAESWHQPPGAGHNFNKSLQANLTWEERLRYGVPMTFADKVEAVREGVPSHPAWLGA